MLTKPYEELQVKLMDLLDLVESVFVVLGKLDAVIRGFEIIGADPVLLNYLKDAMDEFKQGNSTLYHITLRFSFLIEHFKKYEEIYVIKGGKSWGNTKED